MSAASRLAHSSTPFFGATLVARDRTRFRLWAPAQAIVLLEVEGLPLLPMDRLADGWFEIETNCRAGARYRFKLQSGLAVPDPVARAQASDL
jgi:maltooligosyltrehalose trehalohydrolase